MAFGMNNGFIIETDDDEESESIVNELKSSIHSDIELGGAR